MSQETGVCGGFHIGPFYIEQTSNGDINFGVSIGPSGGEGVVGGGEAYAEITFNPEDGFSAGAGVSGEVGEGFNYGPGIKGLSAGSYVTKYISFDSRE